MRNKPPILSLEERREAFNSIVSMFESQDPEQVDVEFVVENACNTGVRDALIHYFSDKYQIDLFGTERITVQDCSERRNDFIGMLIGCGKAYDQGYQLMESIGLTDEAKESAFEYKALILALMYYESTDDQRDSIKRLIATFDEEVPNLVDLIKMAVDNNVPVRVFRESMEAGDIESCLAGA